MHSSLSRPILILVYSHGGGKVWGSDDVNVEAWKPLKRLVGHESGKSALKLVPELEI